MTIHMKINQKHRCVIVSEIVIETNCDLNQVKSFILAQQQAIHCNEHARD